MMFPVIDPRTALRSHLFSLVVVAFVVWFEMTQRSGRWPVALGIGLGALVVVVLLAWTATRERSLHVASRHWNISFWVVVGVLAINVLTPGPLPTWAYVVFTLAGVNLVAPLVYFGVGNFRAFLAQRAEGRADGEIPRRPQDRL